METCLLPDYPSGVFANANASVLAVPLSAMTGEFWTGSVLFYSLSGETIGRVSLHDGVSDACWVGICFFHGFAFLTCDFVLFSVAQKTRNCWPAPLMEQPLI